MKLLFINLSKTHYSHSRFPDNVPSADTMFCENHQRFSLSVHLITSRTTLLCANS